MFGNGKPDVSGIIDAILRERRGESSSVCDNTRSYGWATVAVLVFVVTLVRWQSLMV